MTAPKTTVKNTPPAPSPSDDVEAMCLHERLWHVQTEAEAANGASKAYNGTYAPRTSVWNDILQPLFAKYHLLFVTSLHEYKTKSLTGDMEIAPLFICAIIPSEAPDDYKSPRIMRFHLRNGSEQDIGKQMTYFNRYALVQMCGISVNKDPDDPDAPLIVRANTPRPTVDPRILAGAQNNTTTNSIDEFE